jgi:predicted nucleic acid-binding protein
MTLIVDASVAIKWVLEEYGSDEARDLVADEILAVPDLMFIECANILRTKTKRGELQADFAREALAVIDAIPLRSIAGRAHVAAAHAISIELDCSAYDALYLAVALAERAVLVTADARFARAAQAHPVYQASLRLLSA